MPQLAPLVVKEAYYPSSPAVGKRRCYLLDGPGICRRVGQARVAAVGTVLGYFIYSIARVAL